MLICTIWQDVYLASRISPWGENTFNFGMSSLTGGYVTTKTKAKRKYKKEGKRSAETRWPKKKKLIEAINVFRRFQEMCKLQIDLGYWVTMDFPTKHHINKILSLQYMDLNMIEKVYGKSLVREALGLIPACRSYIAFTKGEYNGKVDNKEQREGSGVEKVEVHEGQS